MKYMEIHVKKLDTVVEVDQHYRVDIIKIDIDGAERVKLGLLKM